MRHNGHGAYDEAVGGDNLVEVIGEECPPSLGMACAGGEACIERPWPRLVHYVELMSQRENFQLQRNSIAERRAQG